MAYMLATDLDMTLVGDDEALERLNHQITELRTQKNLKLVYVTGRSQELYRSLEADKELLKPDALITAVGTEIYGGDGSLLEGWPKTSGWDRQVIEGLLNGYPNLIRQPDSEQRPYKVSYYLQSDELTFARIKNTLQHLDVEVVYSMSQYVDVLPRGVNKGSALLRLASIWDVPATNVITCGDSENDITMLSVGKAVLVGNAKETLRTWAKNRADQNIYLAKAECAAGIEEGLVHWGLL